MYPPSACSGVLAYLVPGYFTFKGIEGKSNQADATYWSKYWVVLAAFSAFQWLIDFLLGWWVPILTHYDYVIHENGPPPKRPPKEHCTAHRQMVEAAI